MIDGLTSYLFITIVRIIYPRHLQVGQQHWIGVLELYEMKNVSNEIPFYALLFSQIRVNKTLDAAISLLR